MPVGYLISVAILLTGVVLALEPPRPGGMFGSLAFVSSMVVNEAPLLGIYYLIANTLLAFTQANVSTTAILTIFVVGCLPFLGTPVLIRRGRRAEGVIVDALVDALGDELRGDVEARRRRDGGGWRLTLAPVPITRHGVRRIPNLSYGPAGRRNRLDVFTAPAGAGGQDGRPLLVHLHGGGFRIGRKSVYARDLLLTLASRGWICVSANYRLRPTAFPDVLVDVKRIISWLRSNATTYGADASRIVLVGSSAGAHLALTAALTPDDPRFQPGFETDDTSVSAAVGLYGYYGRIASGPMPSSPAEFRRMDSPPMLIVHGDQDTLLPTSPVRGFVEQLRVTSARPVVYAELPGAQHGFDLVRSIRFRAVVDGIDAFASWAFERSRRADGDRS